MDESVKRASFSEYLRLEALDERPLEFFDGEVVALATPSLTHGDIVANIRRALDPAADARGCRSYCGDATVEREGRFAARPDFVVTCDRRDEIDPALRRRGILRHPWLVIEVLSPATAAYDLGEKLEGYAAIETITHYLVVDSRRKHLALYERTEGQKFVFSGSIERVALERLGVTLTLDAVYRSVPIAAIESVAD